MASAEGTNDAKHSDLKLVEYCAQNTRNGRLKWEFQTTKHGIKYVVSGMKIGIIISAGVGQKLYYVFDYSTPRAFDNERKVLELVEIIKGSRPGGVDNISRDKIRALCRGGLFEYLPYNMEYVREIQQERRGDVRKSKPVPETNGRAKAFIKPRAIVPLAHHQELAVPESNVKRDVKKENKPTPIVDIGYKDFVVRRAVFKCMHNEHTIDNIVASVKVIPKKDGKADITTERVSAGYCHECNTFFIMASAYEKLKAIGVPLCRMSDEKAYLKGETVHGMKLAQESILMQYGYSVNQSDGLSSGTRHKVLALLIDHRIVSKSEIISYLDFFISQRQSNSMYEIAISKWEQDREFVMGYKMGEFTQFGVAAIYR